MLALMTVGVKAGDEVITNGFTFTALPSTIMRLGAEPVLVEATNKWTMDLDDLEVKIKAFPNAKVLLLSHMRGKVVDMDRVVEICEKNGVTLVEDCAHSCGVTWRGRQLG
jgi:dTDP-4-amino-4,6-dideoxygalactose transaminase